MKFAKSTIAATITGLMIAGTMAGPLSAATLHTNTSNAHRNDVYDIYREVPLVENTPVEIKTSNPHRSDVYDLYAK